MKKKTFYCKTLDIRENIFISSYKIGQLQLSVCGNEVIILLLFPKDTKYTCCVFSFSLIFNKFICIVPACVTKYCVSIPTGLLGLPLHQLKPLYFFQLYFICIMGIIAVFILSIYLFIYFYLTGANGITAKMIKTNTFLCM